MGHRGREPSAFPALNKTSASGGGGSETIRTQTILLRLQFPRVAHRHGSTDLRDAISGFCGLPHLLHCFALLRILCSRGFYLRGTSNCASPLLAHPTRRKLAPTQSSAHKQLCGPIRPPSNTKTGNPQIPHGHRLLAATRHPRLPKLLVQGHRRIRNRAQPC